jgi:hypothetical protein
MKLIKIKHYPKKIIFNLLLKKHLKKIDNNAKNYCLKKKNYKASLMKTKMAKKVRKY